MSLHINRPRIRAGGSYRVTDYSAGGWLFWRYRSVAAEPYVKALRLYRLLTAVKQP